MRPYKTKPDMMKIGITIKLISGEMHHYQIKEKQAEAIKSVKYIEKIIVDSFGNITELYTHHFLIPRELKYLTWLKAPTAKFIISYPRLVTLISPAATNIQEQRNLEYLEAFLFTENRAKSILLLLFPKLKFPPE